MNREQKRKLTKEMKSKGITKEDAAQELHRRIEIQNKLFSGLSIAEGTKVKLNYTQIIEDVNYPRLVDRYKAWIESHKDKELIIVYDEKHPKGDMVRLKDDIDTSIWIFWVGELIVIEDKENN